MSMQWFVLNTLTGQEQKVQKLLKAKAAEGEVDLTSSIGETLMPTERVTTTRGARRTTVTRKLFPGYVFAQLELYLDDRCRRLNKPLWEYVNGLQGVIGFLGAVRSPRGEMISPPTPMTDKEVADIRATMGTPEDKPKEKVTFEKGGELGRFEMGSTVILVVDKKIRERNPGLFQSRVGTAVKVGEAL